MTLIKPIRGVKDDRAHHLSSCTFCPVGESFGVAATDPLGCNMSSTSRQYNSSPYDVFLLVCQINF